MEFLGLVYSVQDNVWREFVLVMKGLCVDLGCTALEVTYWYRFADSGVVFCLYWGQANMLMPYTSQHS